MIDDTYNQNEDENREETQEHEVSMESVGNDWNEDLNAAISQLEDINNTEEERREAEQLAQNQSEFMRFADNLDTAYGQSVDLRQDMNQLGMTESVGVPDRYQPQYENPTHGYQPDAFTPLIVTATLGIKTAQDYWASRNAEVQVESVQLPEDQSLENDIVSDETLDQKESYDINDSVDVVETFDESYDVDESHGMDYSGGNGISEG